MKKNIISIFSLLLGTGAFAQAVSDIVTTGTGYVHHQFYNLENGIISGVEYDSWNIGFGVDAFTYDAPIRFNSLLGDVKELPNADINDELYDVDTTGWADQDARYDSDENIFQGALSRDYIDEQDLDYYWGKYSTTTHIISPTKTFGTQIGADFYVMRFKLAAITNIYTIEFAKLGDTQSTSTDIPLNNYSTKNYVYFNLANNSVVDFEPNKADWDLYFGKYITNYQNIMMYPVTGVLNNVGTQVAEIIDDNAEDYTYSSSVTFSALNNVIGYDWKQAGQGGVTMADTVVYFVKAKSGSIWKIFFTDFISGTGTGADAGSFIFDKTLISTVGTQENTSIFTQVYPNPANDKVQIVVDALDNTQVEIFNLNGQKVYETNINNGFQTVTIPTDHFINGIYQVVVSNNGVSSITKLAVQH